MVRKIFKIIVLAAALVVVGWGIQNLVHPTMDRGTAVSIIK